MRDWMQAFWDNPRHLYEVANIIDSYPNVDLEWDQDGDGNDYINMIHWNGDCVYEFDCTDISDLRDTLPHGLVKKLDDWGKGYKMKTCVGEAAKLPLP